MMKDLSEVSDEELSGQLREQFNKGRHHGCHDRELMRAIAAEASKRGWGFGSKEANNAQVEACHD